MAFDKAVKVDFVICVIRLFYFLFFKFSHVGFLLDVLRIEFSSFFRR